MDFKDYVNEGEQRNDRIAKSLAKKAQRENLQRGRTGILLSLFTLENLLRIWQSLAIELQARKDYPLRMVKRQQRKEKNVLWLEIM